MRGPRRVILFAFLALFTAASAAMPQPGQAAVLSLQLDAGVRHPISPLIYGMNFADPALAAELRLPVNRWGGNSTTRYNYQNDLSNHASDWYFENIYDNPHPENGSTADQFIQANRQAGAQTLLTVPLIGWTPNNKIKACGFSIQKYGPQQSSDAQWDPDCGNGVKPNGTDITGNDPADTSIAIDPTFVQGWIQHLKTQFGSASAGGVRFYDLDNEPMLWNSTHRDVHPQPTSYDELRDRTYQYAAAVKAADPGAQTLGPVLWGWTAYFYSAADEAPGGAWWSLRPDRKAHGDTPFLDWYLQQMHAYETQHCTRILDYLDLHFYPQNGVALANAGDAATQALRLRSTRDLWDPSYTDESWIDDTVELLPRMHAWVDQNYPGTRLAISEYNWGGLESLNGALTQADILGIFGREGLDLATLWAPPSSDQPGAYAFRMYRNYDGAGSAFGETGILSTSADQGQLAVYAALRAADGAMTVMVINKTSGALTAPLAISNFTPSGSAKVYRYSAANLAKIQSAADQPVSAGGFSATYPASSISLYVIPGSVAAPAGLPNHIYLPLAERSGGCSQ